MGLVQDRRRHEDDDFETETQTSLDLKGLSVDEVQALIDGEVEGEPEHECTVCGETFASAGALGSHKRTHADDGPDEDEEG